MPIMCRMHLRIHTNVTQKRLMLVLHAIPTIKKIISNYLFYFSVCQFWVVVLTRAATNVNAFKVSSIRSKI